MKTLLKIPLAIVGVALILVACDNNDHWPLKTIPEVQFITSEGSVTENSGEKKITLTFDQPFTYDARINLLVDASKAQYFTSYPAVSEGMITLEVKKYDRKAV